MPKNKKSPKNERDLQVIIDQEVLHRHPEEPCQRQQVIDGRQALAVLPFVHGLRVFKPEECLNVLNAQSGGLAALFDRAAGGFQIDYREICDCCNKKTPPSSIEKQVGLTSYGCASVWHAHLAKFSHNTT